MVANSTRLSRFPELSYHSPLASFLWLLPSCQDLQERRRDHRAPHTPKTSLNATHFPYAPRTSLYDILRLLYGLYAHECHVKITAQTPVQSIQSQPRRSTGTLTPQPFPLRLPMVISRGNPKVQKATLHGFQDDHQFPRPLQPFSHSSAPYILTSDLPNPP